MPEMEYEYIHPCDKPKMIVAYKEVTTKRLLRKPLVTFEPVYETTRVKWTCPECRTKWQWNPNSLTGSGYWWCAYRPEVWKPYAG